MTPQHELDAVLTPLAELCRDGNPAVAKYWRNHNNLQVEMVRRLAQCAQDKFLTLEVVMLVRRMLDGVPMPTAAKAAAGEGA